MTKDELLEMLRMAHKKMLLNKKQTAQELGISEAGIDRLRRSGELSSRKVLGKIMFSIDEISRFLVDA